MGPERFQEYVCQSCFARLQPSRPILAEGFLCPACGDKMRPSAATAGPEPAPLVAEVIGRPVREPASVQPSRPPPPVRPAPVPIPRRPRGVTFLAVCHFIAAPVALLLSALAVILMIEGVFFGMFPKAREFQQNVRANEEQLGTDAPELVAFHNDVQAKLSAHRPWLLIDLAVLLIFAGILLASAIGLLGMRPWARYLSLGFSIAGLVRGFAMVLYAFVFAIPTVSDIQNAALNLSLIEDESTVNAIREAGTILKILIGILPVLSLFYPLLSLVIVARPSVGRAFAAASAARR